MPNNQDNEISWLDWRLLERSSDVFRFCRELIAFRKRHPSLCRSIFWRDDIHWYGTEHVPDLSFGSRQIAWCLHGASVHDDDIYVMVNSGEKEVAFGIHEGSPGEWLQVMNTGQDSPRDIIPPCDQPKTGEAWFNVRSRSVVALRRPRQTPGDQPWS